MTSPSLSPSPESRDDAPAQHRRHHRRTTGLRVFDVFLYPFFTNFVVFGLSVVATYLTSHGGEKGPTGKLLYGRVGKFFQLRGDWLVRQFERTGMNPNQADMAKMVFFSFADGSLVAPFVKLFEDKRETIARRIDDKLGSTPADLSAYEAEPKQSWGTVVAGRLVTVGVVVPTAVALDKAGLNEKLFGRPGLRLGEWIARTPLARSFGRLDVPGLFKVVFFEFFYTSVCTTGLYFLSRGIARLTGKQWGEADAPPKPHDGTAAITARVPAQAARDANPASATVEKRELSYRGTLDGPPAAALHASPQAL